MSCDSRRARSRCLRFKEGAARNACDSRRARSRCLRFKEGAARNACDSRKARSAMRAIQGERGPLELRFKESAAFCGKIQGKRCPLELRFKESAPRDTCDSRKARPAMPAIQGLIALSSQRLGRGGGLQRLEWRWRSGQGGWFALKARPFAAIIATPAPQRLRRGLLGFQFLLFCIHLAQFLLYII